MERNRTDVDAEQQAVSQDPDGVEDSLLGNPDEVDRSVEDRVDDQLQREQDD